MSNNIVICYDLPAVVGGVVVEVVGGVVIGVVVVTTMPVVVNYKDQHPE